MSTFCTTLTLLNYMYSVFCLSVACPVTPIVQHLTLQHYYLVSLLPQEAHLLIIVSEGIFPFSPRQIRNQIHNLHCTKAFLASCANPMHSESSCMPSPITYAFFYEIQSQTQVRLQKHFVTLCEMLSNCVVIRLVHMVVPVVCNLFLHKEINN